MATYTDNYHLSKPETTDSQQSFIEDYATNMDIIDENMGGGSGGGSHVIIDENDTEMAQEPKMQFAGKVSVTDDDTNEKTVVTLPEEVKEVTLAEYESIPVAERESNGIAYFIKDLSNGNVQGYPPLIYSDEEREVGVWRDGKPLYQKTIHIGALIPTNNTVAHGIGNIERVINIKGYSDQGGRWFPLPYVQTQNLIGYQEKVYVDGTNVYVNLLNDDYISDCYVTIQYTKTTDVAGSGIWNGQGGIAHHYSTNETVIGTWIDGKPLYERTLSLGALPNNAIKTVAHNIANVDLIFVSDSFFQTGAKASSYLNFPNDSLAGQIEIVVDPTNVEIWAGNDRTSWIGYATVRYTKTTG